MKPMESWRKFRNLPHADRKMLLVMSLVLPLIAGAVRCMGFQRVFSAMGRCVNPKQKLPENQHAEFADFVRKWQRYVKRFGVYRGNCLSRSLVIWWLLCRTGVKCELIIGSRFKNGGFQAHAWIERQGIPLNETPEVRKRYTVFEHRFVPGELNSLDQRRMTNGIDQERHVA